MAGQPQEHRADYVVRTGGWPDCYCCAEQQALDAAAERLPHPSILLVWRIHHITGAGTLEPWRAYP